MTPADRAIVAAAEERDRGWPFIEAPRTSIDFMRWDRRELLRIVREQEALLRERDTLAQDAADDAAAGRATAGKWK